MIKFTIEKKTLYEFCRFAVVGVINTIHHYLWYLPLKEVITYDVANVIAFMFSMVGSFFLNTYFTYKVKPSIKKFLQFPVVYIAQLIASYLVPIVSVEFLGVSEVLVPLITTVVSLPLTFIISRYVLTKRGKKIEREPSSRSELEYKQ